MEQKITHLLFLNKNDTRNILFLVFFIIHYKIKNKE